MDRDITPIEALARIEGKWRGLHRLVLRAIAKQSAQRALLVMLATAVAEQEGSTNKITRLLRKTANQMQRQSASEDSPELQEVWMELARLADDIESGAS